MPYGGGPGGPGGHYPGPPGPPRPPKSNGGVIAAVICGALAMVLVAVVGIGFATGWFGGSSKSSSSSEASTPPPLPTPTYGGGIGGSSGAGSSTGGSGGAGGYTPPPRPDPTASAFQRIKAGDCLTLWDTGRTSSTITWSSSMPPPPVSNCDSTRAMMHVSRVTTSSASCSRGPDKSSWSYRSISDNSTTVLCLTRLYHKGYCLLGKQTGTGASARISLGGLTGVDCTRRTVPAPYNQVMHITGVYRATAGSTGANCRRTNGDQTYYYAWKMNDGKTLLCTMIYQPR